MEVKDLPFVKERLQLLDSTTLHDPAMRNHSRDRTVEPVRRWVALTYELRALRPQTTTCLEARPGKNDQVVMVVADKERFASLQEAIESHNKQITELEAAIRKLDGLGDDIWFSNLSQRVSLLMGTEDGHKRRLSAEASNAMARNANTGKSPDEILQQDSRYLGIQETLAADTEAAKKLLAELAPKFNELKAVLESVGC